MADMNTVMNFVLLAGVVIFIVSVCSLIHDSRKHREENREQRRKHLAENTAKTILSYQARQESAASYYRRRA